MRDDQRRVSLVTGAGHGIGQAIAVALADAGDHVVCVDVDGDSAAATAQGLPSASSYALDVRDAPATAEVVASAVRAQGRLDVVVPCAGIFRRAPADEVTEQSFGEVLDVNLKGTFLTLQAAGRVMVEQGTGGAAVLIGSIHSVRAMRQQAAYAASKGAVLALARVLALEWARHGIRVNTVGPGFTETAATAPTRADPERLAAMLRRVPQQRIGQPTEIAAAVRFLASADSGFITGAYLNVDGGWLVA